MKNIILTVALISSCYLSAQVGINNVDPKGTLDITASNQATPSNTDGIIIPRIDAFPATDPGADQNSMLVYLTTTSGTNTPGFYYWDNATASWLPISSSTQDFDWLEQGTTMPPDANTDNIFTEGNVSIGSTESMGRLLVSSEFGDTVLRIEADPNSNQAAAQSILDFIRGENPYTSTGNDRYARIALDGQVGSGIFSNNDPYDLIFFSRSNDVGFQFIPGENPTLTMNPSGQLTLHEYAGAGTTNPFGAGTGFTGTAVSMLALDVDGNIIQEPLPTGSSSTDIDWYEAGTTTAPNAITDNIETQGNVTITNTGDSVLSIIADTDNANEEDNPTLLLSQDGGGVTGSIQLGGNVGGFPNDMIISTANASSEIALRPNGTTALSLQVNGRAQLNSYTTATSFTGTATSLLGVDSAGNIIQEPLATVGADTQDLSIDNTTADLSLVDGGTVEIKTIADSDDDTLIQVEESADEDIIRFDVAGNEKLTINAQGQLQPFNTGTSVFLGEEAGASDDLSTNRNILIGYQAGTNIVNSPNNTVIGWRAMDAAISGVDNNIAIGQSSFGSLTNGTSNVSVGVGSLASITNSSNNVAVGSNALGNSSAGNNNVAIGRSAGSNVDADDNVFIGANADTFNNGNNGRNVVIGTRAGESGVSGTSGGSNYQGRVIIGYEAGGDAQTNNTLYIENSSSVTPLLYGEFDNDILRVGGQLQIGSSDDTTAGAIYSFPTVDGTPGQALTTDGAGNVSWSTIAGGGADTQDLSIDNTTADLSLVDGGTVEIKTIADSDDDTLIQVEESADEDRIRFDVEGSEKLVINNKGHLEVLNTGGSVIIGEGCGTADDGTDNENVFIGKNVAPNASTGSTNAFDSDDNIGIAREALNALTDGSDNIGIGRETLKSVTTQNANIAIGSASLRDLNDSSANDNIAIGSGVATQRTSGDANVFIGRGVNQFNTDGGNDNIAIGTNSLRNAGTSGNVMLGSLTGTNITTGAYNTAIGRFAMSFGSSFDADITGSVALGHGAASQFNFSNLFVVSNTNTTTPLLSGVFANNATYQIPGTFNKGPYNDNRLGVNIDYSGSGANLTHTLTVGGTAKIQDVLNLQPGSAPVTPEEGDIYFDSTTKKLRVFNGTAWDDLN